MVKCTHATWSATAAAAAAAAATATAIAHTSRSYEGSTSTRIYVRKYTRKQMSRHNSRSGGTDEPFAIGSKHISELAFFKKIGFPNFEQEKKGEKEKKKKTNKMAIKTATKKRYKTFAMHLYCACKELYGDTRVAAGISLRYFFIKLRKRASTFFKLFALDSLMNEYRIFFPSSFMYMCMKFWYMLFFNCKVRGTRRGKSCAQT
ncbi:hypothetical protein POVWA2_001560 [Plasmodium ovale wallikeri]|uniref:Secreted protein n=1 Tax=Plasmodium ovale wallikeri TaxID=864142 RepID=A0A1A8YHA9_PLAOA|nr:hypothetical protein POVWA2_001560 [Plasmodium ovale wallikeri]